MTACLSKHKREAAAQQQRQPTADHERRSRPQQQPGRGGSGRTAAAADPWKPVDKYEVYKEPATDKDGALAPSAKPVKDLTKTEMGRLFHEANIFHSNPCMVRGGGRGREGGSACHPPIAR